MSAGAFVRTRYQGDVLTDVYPVRVQPETEALVIDGVSNAALAGVPNRATSAKVSGSRRGFGVSCRTVTIKFTGALPTGYKPDQPIRLPILTPTVYSAIAKGQVGTYLGQPIEVVGKKPEYIN